MTAREELAEVLADHGYWRNPEVGGECPACGHLYYERPPGAYMDPDLEWLRGAIDLHRVDALLASPALANLIREKQAEALREAADELSDIHRIGNTSYEAVSPADLARFDRHPMGGGLGDRCGPAPWEVRAIAADWLRCRAGESS